MAEEINKTYTSNSLYNDSTGVIAFAEQLKQELINWANYQHVTEELGQNRPDFQNELNNLFLSVYERFLTFLNDADASEEAINTWKEIENFLADYTDEKTLAAIVAELNNKIESRLTVPLESTTGSSTTSTMTQKAITEAIDASKTFTTGEKVDNVGIDDEPTAGSANLVKSGGVSQILKQLNTVDAFSSELESVTVQIGEQNKILASNGSSSSITGFFVSEYVDVSDIAYDYYITLTLALSNTYGKVALYDANQKCIYCITGLDVPASKNGIYKLELPIEAKYIRISGSTTYPFNLKKAPKRTSFDSICVSNVLNGNAKPASSDAVYKALTNANKGFIEEYPLSGSGKLPQSKGVYTYIGGLNQYFDSVLYPSDKKEQITTTTTANSVLNARGQVITLNGFVVSDFIDVSNPTYDYLHIPTASLGTSYGKIAFYDANQNVRFVITAATLLNTYNGNLYKLNLPLDVKYVRISAQTAANIKLYKVKKIQSLDEFNLASKDMEVVGGINLYDYTKSSINKYLNPETDSVETLSSGFVSDYIYIGNYSNTQKFTFSNYRNYNNASYVLYDANKEKISGGIYDSSIGIVKGSAVYLRVSSILAAWSPGNYTHRLEMVCAGEQPNVYVPYNKSDRYSLYRVDNYRWFEQVDLPVTSSMQIIETTYEDGIFGGNTGANFRTSDYIQLEPTIKTYYYKCVSSWAASLVKMRFYDKDKNLITNGDLKSGFFDNIRNTFLKVVIPDGCQYIRYARIVTDTTDGLYQSVTQDYETVLKGFINGLINTALQSDKHIYTATNNVLWVGTSIPEGAQYPIKSCQANGYICSNLALGQSSLAIRSGVARCMMYTQQEFYDAFHSQIGTTISQSEYNKCIDRTFERLLPFISGTSLTVNDGDGNRTINPNLIKVSAVVIDHGYNDHASVNALMEDKDNIDWDSVDRTNFVGAFNYLINEIQKVNPTIKIIVGGYFDYTFMSSNKPLGKNLCDLQTLLAQRYNFELLDVWNYSQISWARFVQGTSNYIDNINQQYSKSFTVASWEKDSDGNLRSHKIYCPDGIHPHSDPTGNTNRRLNAVYTKLMKNII